MTVGAQGLAECKSISCCVRPKSGNFDPQRLHFPEKGAGVDAKLLGSGRPISVMTPQGVADEKSFPWQTGDIPRHVGSDLCRGGVS